MHGWLFNDGLKGKLQDLTTEIFYEYTPRHLVFAQETLQTLTLKITVFCICCFLFKFLLLHNCKRGPPLRRHTPMQLQSNTIVILTDTEIETEKKREKKHTKFGMITFTSDQAWRAYNYYASELLTVLLLTTKHGKEFIIFLRSNT